MQHFYNHFLFISILFPLLLLRFHFSLISLFFNSFISHFYTITAVDTCSLRLPIFIFLVDSSDQQFYQYQLLNFGSIVVIYLEDWKQTTSWIQCSAIQRNGVIPPGSLNLVPRVLSLTHSRERGPWERSCHTTLSCLGHNELSYYGKTKIL